MEHLSNAERVELTKAIAFYLNEGEKTAVWKVKELDEPYPTHYIRRADDETCEISVHADWPKAGKVYISGNFHMRAGSPHSEFIDVREWTGSERAALPSITVSRERGAPVIAREIKRRFLPEYLPLWQKAAKVAKDRISYRDKQIAAMRALAEVIGATERAERAIKDNRSEFGFYNGENGSGDIRVSSGVDLKISCSISKAKRILAIMAESEADPH